jgi:transcriptional regulator with XRE-family HTH domain
MRFTEVGQQLRAYRLESGLRAEEIAARLGVSRAALYRYEKGEVIKLDTVKRLAELLNISPLSLLGIGVEYYNRPIGYLERIRQIEESAEQILQISDPICYLTTSEGYDSVLADVFFAAAEEDSEQLMARALAEQVLGILAARKRMYQVRRPGIIAIVTLDGIRRFLELGVAGGLAVSDALRERCREVAWAEVEGMAVQLETEPMGLQLGVLAESESASAFVILRARHRAMLAVNPFRTDCGPGSQIGVALVTGADEAVAAHQRASEAMWRRALRGAPAAAAVRELMREARHQSLSLA